MAYRRDTTLSSPPHRTPMVDENGYISMQWLIWLGQEVMRRIGGGTAITQDQLEAYVATMATPRLRPQDIPDPEQQPVYDIGSILRTIEDLQRQIQSSQQFVNVGDLEARLAALEAQMANVPDCSRIVDHEHRIADLEAFMPLAKY